MYPGSQRATGAWRAEDHAPTNVAIPRGSVAVYVGSLWHGGGANRTDRPRLGVTFEYLAGWLRQQENQTLAVHPGSARPLPERLRELLGYSVVVSGSGRRAWSPSRREQVQGGSQGGRLLVVSSRHRDAVQSRI